MKINKDNIDDDDITGESGEQGGGEEGGKGGKSGGEVHSRDLSTYRQRDDLLPPEEIRRLLIVQQELHKASVDKQKSTRKERQAIKAGQTHVANYDRRTGLRNGGGGSPYKKHWVSNKAQFSGIDRNVTAIPGDNRAETNEANRNELENRLQLRNTHQHRNTPTFNPKPRPY